MGETHKLVWHRGKLAVAFVENGQRFRRSLGTDDVATGKARLSEFVRLKALQARGGPVTMAAIYQAYVADRGREGKATTRIQDAWKRLAPAFGELLPSFVNKDVCRAYQKERTALGISLGTVHLELGYLRASLTHAEREGWITKAPFVPLPQKPQPRAAYLTKPEAAKVLAAAVMPHVKLFITLALATAGRAQAILDLTWSQIDFAKGTIDLRDPLRPSGPKGRSIVPMNEMARTALLAALEGTLSRYVIEWGGARVLSIKKGVGQAGVRAKLKCTPHMLRHTAAVWMAEAGVPMDEIAQYLGHTNSATTFRVYAKFSPAYLRKAAQALEL